MLFRSAESREDFPATAEPEPFLSLVLSVRSEFVRLPFPGPVPSPAFASAAALECALSASERGRYCSNGPYELLIIIWNRNCRTQFVNHHILREVAHRKKYSRYKRSIQPSVLPAGWHLGLHSSHADRKSTRLNSSHSGESRMPSSA